MEDSLPCDGEADSMPSSSYSVQASGREAHDTGCVPSSEGSRTSRQRKTISLIQPSASAEFASLLKFPAESIADESFVPRQSVMSDAEVCDFLGGSSKAPCPSPINPGKAARNVCLEDGETTRNGSIGGNERSRSSKVKFAIGTKRDAQSDLACPICSQVVYRPVRTKCGHVFCFSCLVQWISDGRQKNCPLCRFFLGNWSNNVQSRSWSSTVRTDQVGRGAREEFTDTNANADHNITPAEHEEEATETDTAIGFEYDSDVERQAIATLGPTAYYEREVDVLDSRKEKTLKSKLRAVARMSNTTEAALAGISAGAFTSAAAAWGASTATYFTMYQTLSCTGLNLAWSAHNIASAAFWTAALSSEVFGSALLLGTVAGVSTTAFLSGIRLAAWLDGENRYCILKSRLVLQKQSSEVNSLRILNLAEDLIHVKIHKAKRRVRSDANSGSETASAQKRRKKLKLEPYGNPVAECAVLGKREIRVDLPPRKSNYKLLLSVGMPGMIRRTDVGACRARHGMRFVVMEVAAAAEDLRKQRDDCAKPRPNGRTRVGNANVQGEDGSTQNRSSILDLIGFPWLSQDDPDSSKDGHTSENGSEPPADPEATEETSLNLFSYIFPFGGSSGSDDNADTLSAEDGTEPNSNADTASAEDGSEPSPVETGTSLFAQALAFFARGHEDPDKIDPNVAEEFDASSFDGGSSSSDSDAVPPESCDLGWRRTRWEDTRLSNAANKLTSS